MSILRALFQSPARAAARDLDRRIGLFRAEVLAARDCNDAARLEALRPRPAELGLTQDDVELELEIVDGLLEVAALRKAVADRTVLPEVATSHRALAGEPCRFLAPVCRPDAPQDPGGKLFLTDRRIVYLGHPSLSLSWAHVTSVADSERDLLVRTRPGKVHIFRCNSYADALRGAFIGGLLVPGTARHPSG
jgi:hypothetical protein